MITKWKKGKLGLKLNYAYAPNSIRCGGGGSHTKIPSHILYRAYKIFWDEVWGQGIRFNASTIGQLLFHVIREDGMSLPRYIFIIFYILFI